jgi:hypothetical protein
VDDRDRDSGRSVWFVGDLDDPWVASIADALPEATVRAHCPGDLSEALIDPATLPAVLALHRSVLTRHDAERLKRLRSARTPPTWVVLCYGPHVRYAELERWAELFDAIVPEATAHEVIARRLGPTGEITVRRASAGPRPRVGVVVANVPLRQAIAEACEASGYPVSTARHWNEAPATGPAVWEVPALEPDWPPELTRRGRADPVIALVGFPDRALVAEVRERGASACLELPVDLADLIAVLDRLTAPRVEPAHELPPASAARRHPTRPVAVGGRGA